MGAALRREAALRLGRLLLGVLLLLLAAPLPPALLLAHPPSRPLRTSPADYGLTYETVTFSSAADGAQLRGWYMRADGDRAVVLVHGWLNDRLIHGRGLPLAQALVAHGYSVLLFDLGGHGQSEPVAVTLGAREQGDVAAAVRFVRERGAARVGLIGFSIGAVASLLEVARDPEIAAVVADSAFADRDAFLAGLLTGRAGLPGPYARYALWIFHLVSGSGPGEVLPVAAASSLGGRPVLFIHGTDDRVIPVAESRRLHVALPGSDLWLVTGARHTHSYEADPAGYARRVLDFLGQAMLSDGLAGSD